ncbi:MAG: hypothetical protein O0X57_06985 [Methanocorpusculum sp.]|nr:hypothetical protein [Methanocorpusculum sp.]
MSGQDEKGKREISQMRLTALSRKPGGLAPLPTSWVAFARRICFSSLAIVGELVMSGQDEKGKREISQMRLTALSRKPGGLAPLPTSWVAFAHRIFLTLLSPARIRAVARCCRKRS